MAAPTVTPLEQLIAQYQAAQKPQYAALDTSLQASEQQGNAQRAGLAQAKTNAFDQIEQGSQNKGMYFSGFSPDQQAKYTGATYLPALAQVENTIAAARNTVLKGKADLQTQANTGALGEHQNEQSAYDNYMAEMDKLATQNAFTAQQSASDHAFTASQNAMDRALQRGSAGYRGSGSGSTDTSDPTVPFTSAFANWMKSQKKMPSRQAQDNFINAQFDSHGIKDKGARQVVWNTINAQFKRNPVASKDWTYAKPKKK